MRPSEGAQELEGRGQAMMGDVADLLGGEARNSSWAGRAGEYAAALASALRDVDKRACAGCDFNRSLGVCASGGCELYRFDPAGGCARRQRDPYLRAFDLLAARAGCDEQA